MSILWQYLDKKSAAISALKDYSSMQHIIDHTNEEIDNVRGQMGIKNLNILDTLIPALSAS